MVVQWFCPRCGKNTTKMNRKFVTFGSDNNYQEIHKSDICDSCGKQLKELLKEFFKGDES